MLDAHPKLAIPPETHFIPEVAALSKNEPDLRTRFFQTVVRQPQVGNPVHLLRGVANLLSALQ
jgi:hypothetical protein